MLKLLEGIFANRITTEDVTTSGAVRLRGQLACNKARCLRQVRPGVPGRRYAAAKWQAMHRLQALFVLR